MDIRQIEKALRKQGWEVRVSAKNYRRYFDPAGNYVTSYPSTPSSLTRLRNTLAALRRAGFVWPPR